MISHTTHIRSTLTAFGCHENSRRRTNFSFRRALRLVSELCTNNQNPARLPVLEALKFVPPGANTKEENVLYKLLIGFPLLCSCKECCSDPLLFKPLLSQAGSAAKPAKWCWNLTWKAHRAELEVLAQRAEQKSERARRIPCIRDTNVVRGWRPASDPADGREGRTSAWLLRITLAQLSRSRFGITWPDAFAPLFEFEHTRKSIDARRVLCTSDPQTCTESGHDGHCEKYRS